MCVKVYVFKSHMSHELCNIHMSMCRFQLRADTFQIRIYPYLKVTRVHANSKVTPFKNWYTYLKPVHTYKNLQKCFCMYAQVSNTYCFKYVILSNTYTFKYVYFRIRILLNMYTFKYVYFQIRILYLAAIACITRSCPCQASMRFSNVNSS